MSPAGAKRKRMICAGIKGLSYKMIPAAEGSGELGGSKWTGKNRTANQ